MIIIFGIFSNLLIVYLLIYSCGMRLIICHVSLVAAISFIPEKFDACDLVECSSVLLICLWIEVRKQKIGYTLSILLEAESGSCNTCQNSLSHFIPLFD